MTVKIRKVGSSNVLTVPINIDISNTEFDVYQGADGVIVYTPHKENPFKNNEFITAHDLHHENAFDGVQQIGREDIG